MAKKLGLIGVLTSMGAFAPGQEQATDHERGVIGRRGLKGAPVEEVATDPEGAAARALQ